MFFIPIGLQSRVFKFPWGTLLLIMAVIVLSTAKIWYGMQFEEFGKFELFLTTSLTFDSPIQLTMAVVLLLLFSTYIELRMGTIGYLLTYFLGAYAANYFHGHLAAAPPSFIPIFSLSTLIGTFLVFFSQTSYKVLLFKIPKRKQILLIPSWSFLIVCQVLPIVIQIYSHQKFPFLALLGYLLGCLIASLWNEISYVNKGFLYPDEAHMLLKAKKQKDPLDKIDHILECLKVNPTNPQATEYLFRSIAKAKTASHFFTSDQKDVIATLMSAIIKRQVRIDLNMTIYLLSLLPLNWNLSDIGLVDVNEEDLDFMNELLDNSEWRIAIRLFDAYLNCTNDEKVKSYVTTTLQTTVSELARVGLKPTDQEWLQDYVLFHANGYAAELIKATLIAKDYTESGAA